MRTKKVLINSFVSMLTFIIGFIPTLLVRKIFLIELGEDLLGLSSLYANIISYFSIVELGVGSAIIFSLYKPFAEKNYVKIKGYLSYYSKFYRCTGCIIFCLGILVLPFLKFLIKDNIDMFDAKLYFILFLLNTCISYFFTYKFCLLNVAQETYKVSIVTTISKICIAFLQIVILINYKSFYFYNIIQIVINLFSYILLNNYINRNNKWLKEVNGKIDSVEKEDLIRNIKSLFIHKIGSIVVFSTDNIIISSFINLATVSKYNSYNMIISAIQGVIAQIMNSITPSIGNLLVENNKENAYLVHKRLFFINFWIVSNIIILLYNTLTQFVNIWLGPSQTLNNFTLCIILLNQYFHLMRSSVEKFKDGSGNYYQDRYASVFESIINIFFSIILVKLIGLPGVFIGTLISNICVIFWIKPLITYRYVFNKPVYGYFKMYFYYLCIGLIPLFLTSIITYRIKIYYKLGYFIFNCLINLIIINLFYFIIFWKNPQFIYFMTLAIKILKREKL